MATLRRPPIARAVLGVSVLALLVLTSCASQPLPNNGNQARTGSEQFPQISNWRQVSRPIDQYLPTATQMIAITAARFAARDSCLARAGHPGLKTEPANYPAFVAGAVRDRVVRSDLYGFFDTDNVGVYGYVRPPDIPGFVSIPNDPAGVPAPTAKACVNSSVASVPAVNLPGNGPDLAVTDPRVTGARDAWASCMHSAGFLADDPIGAEADHQSVSTEDIAVAKQDIVCKRETNFVGIAVGVQAELDNQYISAHKAALGPIAKTLSAYPR